MVARFTAKRRSRPLSRDESACFRGATHVRRKKRPLAFCCGKGAAPVSGPAGRAVSRPPAAGPSSHGTLLWCGGVNGTCSVRAVSTPTILSRKEGKVNPYSVSGTKNTLPQLPVGSPSTISMDTAGSSLLRVAPSSVTRMGQQSSTSSVPWAWEVMSAV